MRRLLPALIYFLSGFFPRKAKRAVFGAWLGKRFSDNPKYLLLHLAGHGATWELIWIGEESVRSAIAPELPLRFVRMGSWQAVWYRLTAGCCFVTHSYDDLGHFNLMRGARRFYLGHGLAIKHMGSRDVSSTSALQTSLKRLLRHRFAFDYYIASSKVHREKLLVENATCNITPSQILECGQPRIDFLIQNAKPERAGSVRQRLATSLKIPASKLIITYLPTFRDKGMSAFSFCTLNLEQRKRLDELLLKLDAVLLEKSHFQDVVRGNAQEKATQSRVLPLGGVVNIDTQELLLISDLLITDYSGCYVDFLVLQRPIFHFAYDRSYYENSDRGLYFDLDEVAGGPIVGDFDLLCRRIESSCEPAPEPVLAQGRARTLLTEFEVGTASEQISAVLSRGASL